jgi:hypothetical protein
VRAGVCVRLAGTARRGAGVRGLSQCGALLLPNRLRCYVREWLTDYDMPFAKMRALASTAHGTVDPSWKRQDPTDTAAATANDEL